MTREQLIKQLRTGLLLTLLISPIGTFIAIQIIFATSGFEAGQVVTIMAFVGFLWALVLGVCSTTVFLNTYPQIRENLFYSLLSYYLIPIWATVLVFVYNGSSGMWKEFLVMNIPFFLTQTWFFVRFRQTLSYDAPR